jgi:putative DNA methylase
LKYKKKLIEVALPLETINAEAAREKSIRHGHPSTLHLWWARRPLAAARAVIWASLVDDPSSLPEQFPTEEEQNAERERLFKILSDLVKWENSNNKEILDAAKAEIMKSTDGKPPALLDPFAGGGAIPLEAQRLGLEAHASDLNPVAVMINKAMIEIPPKFAGQAAVNPESNRGEGTWVGAQGLAEDVRYYGEWMKKKAFERIGHLYPKVQDEHGQEHTVIAWIWARTVKCPNPACGCEMPLASSFELSKKKGKEAYIQPVIEGTNIRYEVRYGKNAPEPPKIGRGQFKCICCGEPVQGDYIKAEGVAKRMSAQLMAIVTEGKGGRLYFSPSSEHKDIANYSAPEWRPVGEIPRHLTGGTCVPYGLKEWGDLFTNRQLKALITFSELVTETQTQVVIDGGSEEYARAVGVYLAFAVDRQANYSSTLNTYADGFVTQTFGRQALPMVWDYSETNVFSNSTGNWIGAVEWIVKCFGIFPCLMQSIVTQRDAQTDNGMRNVMVSTDPPYYDNIAYADLSDFFYVWLRQTLKNSYPDLFKMMLVPKAEELTAMPYRFDNSKTEARNFFETGMLVTFKQIYIYSRDDIPITVYYAYKQSEDDSITKTASTGWETMLSAIIRAGFTVTGTWPIHTERETGLKDSVNALATSIVLVCRKRHPTSPSVTRRDFINILKRELRPALHTLQASNIAPVDLAQSAIGPGISVYSRFSAVLEADGTPMPVRSALQIINQELDLYFTEQSGDLDGDSRFCVDLYTQYAFNDMKFGEADVLARAKGTSVDHLDKLGVLSAQKGIVRLLTREEIPEEESAGVEVTCIWLLAQRLTRAMDRYGVTGVAQIITAINTSEPEHAKSLAYRLFTIAERKGWAQEAYAYNSLVIAWPEVQAKAAELRSHGRKRGRAVEQVNLFG